MLFNNNSLGFGIGVNPLVNSFLIKYFAGKSVVVPPGDQLWVEDGTGAQMVTEDLSQQYVFVGV